MPIFFDQSQFIHLDVHSEYSLMNSIFKINDIKKACQAHDFSGVGINDFNTLHKPYTIQQLFRKDPSIPAIVGVKFLVKGMFDDSFYTLLLYAKSYKGYLELVKLSTLANSGEKEFPYLTYEQCKQHSLHLICLSGGESGELFHLILQQQKEQASQLVNWCQNCYGKDNYYIELTNHFIKDEQIVNHSALLNNLVFQQKVPCVACNDVFYYKKEHAQHRDIALGMNPNPQGIEYSARYVMYNDEFYFKSYEEMKIAFQDVLKTFPDCFENTIKIFNQCKNWKLEPKRVLPQFPIADEHTSESYFDHLIEEGFQKRKQQGLSSRFSEEDYRERLEYEKKIIKKMGFVDYHLIVQDFINWAKDDEVYQHPETYFPRSYFSDYETLSPVCTQKDFPILIGPGRGSAAGSLVCYCLFITDRDPLKYKLLFERFLNPERVSMPDIDVDIPNQHRHFIVEYLQNKYGYDHVSQIATFQTLGVRSILKSVGKKLGLPYALTDELSKNIPHSIVVDVEKEDGSIEQKEKPVELISELESIDYFKDRLRGNDTLQKLFQFGRVLEGLPISTGKHAAGCVICSVPIDEVVPLMEVDGVMVTQFEKHDTEDIGLLKMDLLGLLNLDIIERCVQMVSEYKHEVIDLRSIPEDDPVTFELFQNGESGNVFQFEGSGMRRLLKKIHPTELEHLNAACALYRPGPMQFIDEYLQGKNNPEHIRYPNEIYKEVTEETNGILVYQEQIMSLVQKIAGFSLGEADILRRGIGKKEEALLVENRKKFVEGGLEHSSLSEGELNQIYDTICRFASYGFNRSHSCAYSWISYLCGYLKAHYPAYYMAACLTLYSENNDKLASTLVETKQMGIPLLPPDISCSKMDFSIEYDAQQNEQIRYSFHGIKGIGEDLASVLEQMPDCSSFYDYVLQIPSALLRMDKIKFLIHAGVFDAYGSRQGLALEISEKMDDIKMIKTIQKEGITPFISVLDPPIVEHPFEYPLYEKISLEKERLQTTLSGHPLDSIRPIIQNRFNLVSILDQDFLDPQDSSENTSPTNIQIPVLLKDIRVIKTKKTHEDMAFFVIEDENLTVDGVCFPKDYNRNQHVLREDVPLLISGKVQYEEETFSIQVQNIQPIEYNSSALFLEKNSKTQAFLPELSQYNGMTKVYLIDSSKSIPVIEKQNFAVASTQALFDQLQAKHIFYRCVVLS